MRLLLKHPGFSVTAICVLALGIGVNAGIFGIINGVLIRPIAGDAASGERVGLYSHDRTTTRGYRAFSYAGFEDVRAAGGPFARLAAHNVALAGVTEGTTTRQTMVDIISTGYLEALASSRFTAANFTIEEERPGTPERPVIVSYKYWERAQFDRGILTQTIRINGQDYGIVGVTPQGFGGTTAIIGTEFFLPLGVHDAIENDFDSRDRFPLPDRRNHSLIVIGRLKPELTRAQADEQLKVMAAAHEQAYPDTNRNQELIVRPLSRMGISTNPTDDSELWMVVAMLQGLAATVLLTSCLNLANMMLAFGSTRQKEIAIRLAGGALGMIAATWAAQLLVSSVTTVLPVALALDLTPDTNVVTATLIFCTLATVAFGLWPALRLSRPDLLSSLKDQSGEITGRIAGRITVRGALVTAQLALSLALLVMSGLFVRGAAAGASADPGFVLDPIVVAQVDPRLGGYDDIKSKETRRAVLERLRGTSGIEAASASTVVPFGDYTMGAVVQREGRRLKNEEPEARGKITHVLEYVITADYFRTIGMPMLRGREFTTAEEVGADSGQADSRPMTIVGVAPTVRHDLFAEKPEEHIYLPSGASGSTRMFVFARAAAPLDADSLVRTVRSQLRSVDDAMPVMNVKSFRAQHETSAQVWILRAAAQLFLSLGLAAVFVAVVGLYGVRSYLVARRTREFGVRMAVGASPVDVMRLVVREAVTTTTVGLAIGLGLGILLGWAMGDIIYGIDAWDPVTLAGATGVLAVASIVAAVIPARRAANVAPMTALRGD